MTIKNSKIKEKLALAYQIIAYLKLDDHTYTHLSARADEISSAIAPNSTKGCAVNSSSAYFIYEFGLRFSEVTAQNLMKISNDEVIEGVGKNYNITGYNIHGAIYQARPDINAIFHLHTPATVAVSAMEQGLMPISQWALHFYGNVSYHHYDSLILQKEQTRALVADLGRQNMVIFLRNHGFITCGKTIEEAMFYTYHLEQACQTQCIALASNQKLIIPSVNECRRSVADLLGFEKNLGERDWQAWVRILENGR